MLETAAGLLAALAGGVAYAALPVRDHGYRTAGRRLPGSARAEPALRGADGRLSVLTWNVAYAYGPGSEAQKARRVAAAHFAGRLERIAKTIAAVDPDVALLQEVDFDARRSYGVDQAQWLVEHGAWPAAHAAVGWSVRFLPYPLSLKQQPLGRVASGGLVLSRLPLAGGEAVDYHARPAKQAWWYNMFYLRRYSQRVAVTLPNGEAWTVVNNHLEDQCDASRRAAAARLRATVEREERVLAVGGDFNAAPQDPAVALLAGVKGLQDAAVALREGGRATYPSVDPGVRIDHLFVGKEWKVVGAEVVTAAGDASDHLPLVVRLERT